MQNTSIGFIGLGQMGQPMAANLVKAGHRLRVWNRRAERAAPLAALGATVAERPEDVAEAGGIVFSSLPNDRVLEELFGPHSEILRRLGPGGVHVSTST